jgi:CheY-like chemotaxis protein
MDSFSRHDAFSLPFVHSRSAGPSVLVVEDDLAVREMLACVLEAEGFNVTEADCAETGLGLLDQYEFDVVLTDYSLPRGDGAWMLREAAHKGRLAGIPAFIVTAHFDQPFGDDFMVIPKPLDLDGLVALVRRAVEQTAVARRRRPAVRPVAQADDRASGDRAEGGPPIELVLYTSSHSPHAATVLRNVQAVLHGFTEAKVHLTVHDLSKTPEVAQADQVPFTPTILSPGPGPRTWIIGHLDNPDILRTVLLSVAARQK